MAEADRKSFLFIWTFLLLSVLWEFMSCVRNSQLQRERSLIAKSMGMTNRYAGSMTGII